MKKYFIVFLLIFMSIFSLQANEECDFLLGEWTVILSFSDKEDVMMNASFFIFEGEYRVTLGENEFSCFIEGDYFFIGSGGYYITIEDDDAFSIIPAHDASFIMARFRRKDEL